MLKLAYNLQGERVPYDSEDFNLRIRLRGDSMDAEHRGLPVIGLPSGLAESAPYMPEGLAKKVREDLREYGGDSSVLLSLLVLPDSEETARSFAGMLGDLNERMPLATSGRFLSTMIGYS